MLRLALTFVIVALVAALFGFTGLASLSFETARILFFIFLVLAVLCFVGNLSRGSSPRDFM